MPEQKPQKFVNFPLTPQKNRRDQKMPTGLTSQKRLWGHPSEKFIHGGRGGGGGWWLDIKRECTQSTEPILAAGIERDQHKFN